MAAIELERVKQKWADRTRAYELRLDGKPVGEIRGGETKTFEVPEGRHEVSMHIDWCQSPPIELDLQPGETAHLQCRAGDPSRGLWSITFGRKRYIHLERAQVNPRPRDR